MKATKLHEK